MAPKFMPVLAALGAAAAMTTPAHAAITLASAPGPWTDAGFVPSALFDFEVATPRFTGGLIATGSVTNVRAQPFSSTGNYATVSPADGTPGYFDLTGLGPISKISFLWGSIDAYNDLDVLDASNNVIATFNGTAAIAAADGNQIDPMTNRLVTLIFTGGDQAAAAWLRFRSSNNAFEFDNIAVLAVPEASTWTMMLAGFCAVGLTMRRKRTLAVSFA